MSVQDFAKTQFIKSFNTGEQVKKGGFRINQDGEWGVLGHIIYIHGTLSGSERIRSKIYSDVDHQNLLYTSDWTNISETQKISGSAGWFGYIRNDLNGKINGVLYTMWVWNLITTPERNTFYIGLTRDFPFPIYKITPTPAYFYEHPLATQIWIWVYR
jgi:hypothetical protein